MFRRLEGASTTLSIEDVRGRLADGLEGIDDEVIEAFAQVLPMDDYLPLLLSVTPSLTTPMRDGDYFGEEQVSTWGLDCFWGLPQYPSTPDYRTFTAPVRQDAHLFAFVVPMVPPTWDDPATVQEYSRLLEASDRPTAVAVSTLDLCQPAMSGQSTDYHEHWCLTHFLLDGHHKMHAAAVTGRPLRLLCLVGLDAGLAGAQELATLPALRAQAPAPRRSPS